MKSILVVDDSKANLTLAKQALDSYYQVTLVISGAQALKYLEKKTADLILLDINMPDMDGLETLLKIKARPETADIPVIFLTAKTDPETEVACLEHGATDFIGKPFVPQVMRGRIARTLELEEFRRQAENKAKRFENIASKDAMTGLWNRSYLSKKIEITLASGSEAAYMMIDVDHFKSVNDKLGHIMGDTVLTRLAHMLCDAFPNDTVARIGGDEFVVFVENPPCKEEISKQIENLQFMVNTDFAETTKGIASISVGVALAPEHGTSLQTLYDHADRALYIVKKDGKNGYRFYEDNLPSKAKISDRPVGIYTDIRILMQQIQEPGTVRGAYWQEYEPFLAIFRFVERAVSRTDTSFCVLLVTIHDESRNLLPPDTIDSCMDTLYTIIQGSLRKGDVFTKYSSSQYVVMLPSAFFQEGGEIVANRIVEKFRTQVDDPAVRIKAEVTMFEKPDNPLRVNT